MKRIFSSLVLLGLLVPSITHADSSFREVWNQVSSDPYAETPHYEVSFFSFFHWFTDRLRQAADRTLSDHSDLLPPFRKLVHANGICFAGTWNITEENPYTGYFAKGSHGLIIARASAATSETTNADYRALAMAGKIFPTTDVNETQALPTANFFTVDDLGGTKTPHYVDTLMTNHPAATSRLSVSAAAIAVEALKAFRLADKSPGVRQMYEVAELGLGEPASSHTPDYFGLQAAAGQVTSNAADFREELRLTNRGGHLVMNIFVAGSEAAPWQRIGYVDFTQEAFSDSCDHRLHFHHPRWRNHLN